MYVQTLCLVQYFKVEQDQEFTNILPQNIKWSYLLKAVAVVMHISSTNPNNSTADKPLLWSLLWNSGGKNDKNKFQWIYVIFNWNKDIPIISVIHINPAKNEYSFGMIRVGSV